VKEVLEKLLKSMNIQGDIESVSEYVEDRAFNDSRYCIDSRKLVSLGWYKEISFEEGLNSFCRW
jgi:dTDP-D-glucose 4,6-dehydratase